METQVDTGTSPAASAPRTVLIVDDEPPTREICGHVARELGFRAVLAETTEKALDLLEQYLIEIVMTDLMVPEAGGIELLKRIRADHPQTAVLIMTQYGTIATAVEATRLGALDYITKPFHVDDLRTKRSEEHTSELQSPCNLVCRLLLEKKKKKIKRENIQPHTEKE